MSMSINWGDKIGRINDTQSHNNFAIILQMASGREKAAFAKT